MRDIEFIIASNECGVIYLSNDQTPEYVNRHIERFYNQANKVTGYEADQYHTHYIEELKLYFAGKQQYLEWPLNLAVQTIKSRYGRRCLRFLTVKHDRIAILHCSQVI